MKIDQANEEGFSARMQQIEALIAEIEAAADSPLRSSALTLIQTLMELHGTGFHRVVEIAQATGENGRSLINQLARDSLVGSLLSLYDLNPIDLENRVEQALKVVHPYLQSQGNRVALLSIENGIAHLEVGGNGMANAATMRRAIEDAIYQFAPDIKGLEFSETAPPLQLIQLQSRRKKNEEKDHCEICSSPITNHQHLFEPARSKLVCACEACTLLLSDQANGKYRRVTKRTQFLAELNLTEAQWQELMIPIGIAFIYHNSSAQKMLATYPSPAGPIEAEVDWTSWQAIAQTNSHLAKIGPDVEALLVNRLNKSNGRNKAEYYLVSIDQCYQLIGLIRTNWQGLTGGALVWPEIEKFFQTLKLQSK